MPELNDENREAWDANAAVWDARMGDDGNDFFRLLCWPAMLDLLGPISDRRVLDIACGNGLTSRKLAGLGAQITAFDFSASLIDLARKRENAFPSPIRYEVVDATDETALLALGQGIYEAAFSNMALFDIADIEPLFRALPHLLKPGGIFVFSIAHPAFNQSSATHMSEEIYEDNTLKTIYSVKVSRYMTSDAARGLALRNQVRPQVYFERPIQFYLNTAFRHGFILDGFAERAFPPEVPSSFPLSWGGNFSEIPPVIVLRVRHLG